MRLSLLSARVDHNLETLSIRGRRPPGRGEMTKKSPSESSSSWILAKYQTPSPWGRPRFVRCTPHVLSSFLFRLLNSLVVLLFDIQHIHWAKWSALTFYPPSFWISPLGNTTTVLSRENNIFRGYSKRGRFVLIRLPNKMRGGRDVKNMRGPNAPRDTTWSEKKTQVLSRYCCCRPYSRRLLSEGLS